MAKNLKPINLALQGGGAHGAFAWGVLDRLLEDGRIAIEAISATSAGAMNAAVLAYGFAIGGADGARAKLEEFWRETSRAGELYSPVRSFPWEKWLNGHSMEQSPSFAMFEAMTRVFSPYQLNPFDFNPLRDVLVRVIDFDRLCRCNETTRLYISAANVRTGKIRVFHNQEMSPDAILASACLPYIFKAVEIDGEHYWDGGYMGNPAIFPLIYHSKSKDVVLIHINPIERAKLPTTSSEIFNRINEISFNSSLMREMRAIAFVTKLIDDGALDKAKYNRMLIHAVRADADMSALSVASKLNPDWDFLCHLRDVGRNRAAEWLGANFDKIGVESSVDVEATYL
jgi:NTE family protein